MFHCLQICIIMWGGYIMRCVWTWKFVPEKPLSAAPGGNTSEWFILLGDIKPAGSVCMIHIQWNDAAAGSFGVNVQVSSQVMFRTCPLVIQATGRTVVNLHLPTVSDWLYWAAKSKQCISVDGKERSLHVKKKKKKSSCFFIWNVAVGSVGAGLEEVTQENIHALCIYASRRKQVSVSHNLRHSLTFILVRGSQKKKNLSMSILQDAELAANKPPHNVTAHWEIWLPGFYLFFKLCIFKGFFQMNY